MKKLKYAWAVVFLVSGCVGGGSAPVPSAAISNPDGLQIEGGSDGQRAQLAFSIRTVDSIFSTPDFWSLVKEREMLLRAPEEQIHRGKPLAAIVDGAYVADQLKLLRASTARYKLVRVFSWWNVWRWIFAGNTTAQTFVCGRIEILRRNIDSVPSLINTVAHENTHRLGMGTGAERCAGGDDVRSANFVDGDYTHAMVPWLVSYVIGDMAQCFYEAQGERSKTLACMDKGVEFSEGCRPYAECCEAQEGSTQELVVKLRELDSRCNVNGGCKALKERCESSAIQSRATTTIDRFTI